MSATEALFAALRQRLPYVKTSSYAQNCHALYISRWSIHWGLDGPVKVIDGKVMTVYERPRRSFTIYNGLHTVIDLNLWPHKGFCDHGFRPDAWWHRCDYVTASNPKGRPSDQELHPEDYDEDGVHWMDRTCFCETVRAALSARFTRSRAQRPANRRCTATWSATTVEPSLRHSRPCVSSGEC